MIQPINIVASKAKVELSQDDLIILHNALTEILHGLEVPEFETRIGYSRARVSSLQESLKAVAIQLTLPKQ
jgi:hypothetical protein